MPGTDETECVARQGRLAPVAAGSDPAAIPAISQRPPARKPRLTAIPGREILPGMPLNFLSFAIDALFCLPADETTLARIPMERPAI